MNLILKCVDFLRNAVEMVREGRPLVSNPELIEQLAGFDASTPISNPSEPAASKVASQSPIVSDEQVVAPNDTPGENSGYRRLVIYFDKSIELPELKAELILARLSDIAVIHRSSPDIDELGAVAELGTLQIWLTSNQEDETLQSAADIVGVDFIELDHVSSCSSEDTDAVESIPTNSVAEIGSPTPPVTTATSDAIEPVELRPAASETKELAVKGTETLRVDIQRLDRLMNLTGELVVHRARLVQLASQMNETFKKSGLLSSSAISVICCETPRRPLKHQTPWVVMRISTLNLASPIPRSGIRKFHRLCPRSRSNCRRLSRAAEALCR